MQFEEALKQVATEARERSAEFARSAYRTNRQSLNKQEFKTISESSAFIAFITLGGNPDQPAPIADTESWIRETRQNIIHDYCGKGSSSWDFRARLRGRRTIRGVEGLQWSTWTYFGSDDHSQNDHICDTHQEAELRDKLSQEGLLEELTQILAPHEFYLFVEHYLKGRSMRDLGAELAGRELTPKESQQAKQRVNSILHRGRVRAAKQLGSRWKALAAEATE